MSAGFSRAALTAYRLAGSLAYPLIGPYVGWRASRGKEDRVRLRERYGHAGLARTGPGPLVWVHAASIGESVAVSPLVRQIAGEGIAVLMTTGTVTSAELVAERLGETVIHQYAPLDLRPSVTRFLDHWRPALAIGVESEIWPTTMQELGRRSIPQLLVNGRLSDRSFKRWQAAPALARTLFGAIAHIVAQSEEDGARFRTLGARQVTVAGNLKADAPPLRADPAALAQARQAISARPVFAAVSTHAGEEAIAADVHARLRADNRELLTIIVPRHVERGEALERDLKARGLAVARRSRGEHPGLHTDILLGDTIGEMGLYLALTEIAFVGRSLHGGGGQNPLEAAMTGAAILSGRSVHNFREVYQRLLAAGAVRMVEDGDHLAREVSLLLGDAEARRAMIGAARGAVAEMGGALPRTLQALEPFLRPLRPAGDRPVMGAAAR